MKKIFLYDQDRALLIFLLLVDLKRDKIIYISYNSKKEILLKLKGEKITFNIEDFLFKNRIKMIFIIKKFRKEYKKIFDEIRNKKSELYGIDYLDLAKRVFYEEPINVIEEGTAIFSSVYLGSVRRIIRYFLIRTINFIFKNQERIESFDYDKNNKIKKIYLTDNLCKELPEKFKNKGEIINLKKLWDKKTLEEKEYILDVFSVDRSILKKISQKSVILVTQPLSEDNLITEKEKIEIYSKILKKYKKDFLIIKPHPREKTDYSKYFPECYVMKEKYPIEILSLIEIEIKKIITLFSGAAFGFGKDVEIDFYGTEVHPKLFERFGSQDKVMKRNAFL